MQEVARAGSCGRATLYRHFAGRGDFVRAIRLRALRDCRAALATQDLDTTCAVDALASVLATLIPVLDRYRVLLDAPPPDLADPAQRELADAITVPLRALIARGQAAAELDPTIPPDFAVAVFTGILRAARERVASGTMHLEAAHRNAPRALLFGLGASGPGSTQEPRLGGSSRVP